MRIQITKVMLVQSHEMHVAELDTLEFQRDLIAGGSENQLNTLPVMLVEATTPEGVYRHRCAFIPQGKASPCKTYFQFDVNYLKAGVKLVNRVREAGTLDPQHWDKV